MTAKMRDNDLRLLIGCMAIQRGLKECECDTGTWISEYDWFDLSHWFDLSLAGFHLQVNGRFDSGNCHLD